MIKKVVVAGCRDYTNYDEAKEYIDFCISDIKKENTIVFVSGGGSGADLLGARYAKEAETAAAPAVEENIFIPAR